MAKDYEGDIQKDIDRYLRTGKLPIDRDLSFRVGSNKHSPYWNWVSKYTLGQEPLYNSGEIPVEEDAESTSRGKLFADWIKKELPTLSADDQELFHLLWEKNLAAGDVGKVMGMSKRTVFARAQKIRNSIAAYVGIKE